MKTIAVILAGVHTHTHTHTHTSSLENKIINVDKKIVTKPINI